MIVFDHKHNLRLLCKLIYYLGFGNFWYESIKPRSILKRFYKIWSAFVLLFLLSFYIDQSLGFLRGFSKKEATDFLIILVGNTVILTKLLVFLSLRSQLKLLLGRLPDDPNATEEYQKASMNKALIYGSAFCVTVYFVLAFKTINEIMEVYTKGAAFNLVVVYYPSATTPGILASILRLTAAFHWVLLANIMCITDILTTLCLVILEYRFKSLQGYFKNLGEKVGKKISERQNIEDLREEYYNDFVEGIKMHEEALWCAHHVQYTIGNNYSIQILTTISMITIHLLRIVSIQRPVVDSIPDLAYIAGLLIICGTYMNSAGDVTHEAYRLSEYMMHSGVLSVGDRRLRTLVTIAIQRAQQPVHMTAFGVVYLTQSNFIAVLRATYSFYAVMR